MTLSTAVQNAPPAPIDLGALKTRQQGAWSSGDYAVVGTTLQIVGEDLCEALDIHAGQKVLDVAAGNGNATLAAARRWCDVVSTDYVPACSSAAGCAPRPTVCRSSSGRRTPRRCPLPTPVSTRWSRLSASCSRRTRTRPRRGCSGYAGAGGKIGLANWTPDGFIGQLFKTLGKYLPPPSGARSPALWGTRARITEMFGPSARAINAVPRNFMFRYRSPEHFLEIFRTYYGPMLKAFAALDAANQQGLRDDLLALIGRMNRAEDGTMIVPSEYLEIVITRR